MRKELYVDICREALLPFLNTTFALPSTHRLMQDNDPKHVSRYTQKFMASNGVNWWKTPAESLDLNLIENLWHELKEFIRRETKPKTKERGTCCRNSGFLGYSGYSQVHKIYSTSKKSHPSSNSTGRPGNRLLVFVHVYMCWISFLIT